jgi:hypothetical protein
MLFIGISNQISNAQTVKDFILRTSPVLWLDASDTTTITTGSTFTWSDKSGNGNDATQSTSTNQPSAGGDIGGNNAISFDGVNDKLTVSADSTIANVFDTGGTVFFIGKPSSDGGGNFGRIFDKTTNGSILLLQNEIGSTLQPRLLVGFSTTNGDWKTTANSIDIGAGNIITLTYDGSSESNDPIFTVNESSESVTEDVTPVGSISDDSAADLTIGNSAGGTRGYDGLYGELIIYDRALTANEVSLVTNYLVNKWSI